MFIREEKKKKTRETTTAKENHNNRKYVFIREEEKKKKKKPREEYVFIKERLGRAQAWFPCGVIRAAAWVCTAWVALRPSLA